MVVVVVAAMKEPLLMKRSDVVGDYDASDVDELTVMIWMETWMMMKMTMIAVDYRKKALVDKRR